MTKSRPSLVAIYYTELKQLPSVAVFVVQCSSMRRFWLLNSAEQSTVLVLKGGSFEPLGLRISDSAAKDISARFQKDYKHLRDITAVVSSRHV